MDTDKCDVLFEAMKVLYFSAFLRVLCGCNVFSYAWTM